MERKNKYAWHDTRNNPCDLPKDGDRVLFFVAEGVDNVSGMTYEDRYFTGRFETGISNKWFNNDDYEGYVTESYYDSSKVIAWRYIEPFGEE